MYDYVIYSQLKRYARVDKSFHMPGHKARGDFKARFASAPFDITELPYSDNLACPTGIIAKAQKDIATILGTVKSFILTDGSSSGVLAMIYAVRNAGTKLIVPRNSHASVWNACRLFGIEPVVVQGEEREGVLLPPEPELIEKLLSSDRTIIGMIVTSPDYYGNIAPLAAYSEIIKKYNRYFLVDGAHGAHLAFGDKKADYAGLYADVWVDGAHKTLPALTQGAILSVNDEKLVPNVADGLSIFRTTSPSYPIMASVEYSVKYLKNTPKLIEEAKAAVAAFREKCPLKIYPSDDWTKLAIDCSQLGVSSRTVARLLEDKGVYSELSDGRYVLFYLSPMVTAADLNGLLSVLTGVINNKKLKKDYVPKPPFPAAERTYSFQYALKQRRELVPLSEATGRMCACNAGIAPPCTPVVVAGEMITETAVNAFKGAYGTFGLVNGKIWVVKK